MSEPDQLRESIEKELVSYVPALQKFASRFHPARSDVDDLVQDTIMKGLANLDKFRPGTELKSWLFTIMRNTFCSKFQTSKREQVSIDDDCAARASTQPSQEWSLRGHELEEAIARLPDHYRDALDTVFIQGVSYEAAAASFHCPVGTIKSRVSRAREILTRELR